MTIESIKTRDKSEALAVIAKHVESPDELYVRIQHLDGEYAVEVFRPSHTAVNLDETTSSFCDS